jgi:polysaccharide pyruvyl transferase WcaK-like protein
LAISGVALISVLRDGLKGGGSGTILLTANGGDRCGRYDMKVYAPFGFYGAGNTGDEATLQGFACLAKLAGRDMDFTIASHNPAHTAKIEPSFHYVPDAPSRLRGLLSDHLSHGYVFAGGTPIQDGLGGWPLNRIAPLIRHAKQWNRPVVFVGVGVERLKQADSVETFRRDVAPNVACWTVRSENDRQRLIDMDVPAGRVTVAADMAWMLSSASPDFGRKVLAEYLPQSDGRPLIGVNVNAEAAMLADSPKMFEILAEAFDRIVTDHNARIVFLSNETRDEPTYDWAASKRTHTLMKRKDDAIVFPNTYLSPHEMMSIVGQCQLTISSRYHFCLFSALQGVPFIPLKRSDKVADLAADLHWRPGCTLREMTANVLADQARQLLQSPEQDLKAMAQRIPTLRDNAKLNRLALETLRKEGITYSRLDWLKTALRRVRVIT